MLSYLTDPIPLDSSCYPPLSYSLPLPFHARFESKPQLFNVPTLLPDLSTFYCYPPSYS
jgi:hypothetical protein